MKLKIMLLAAWGGLLFATSCKTSTDVRQAEENASVQRLVLNERILLEDAEGSACTLLLDMDFFSGEDFSALNRAVIEEAFAVQDKVSFITAAARYRDTVQENFRRDWGELRKDFSVEEMPTFLYEYIMNGRILDTGKIYQTYRLEKYTYLGGAHGISSVKYFNFLNDKKIGVAEAFGENYQEKLGKLLLDCLMAQEGVQSAAQLAEQGYWVHAEDTSIVVSEDFHCTEDTCFFFYQPYELAAGFKGVVEIPVPQAKLREAGVR